MNTRYFISIIILLLTATVTYAANKHDSHPNKTVTSSPAHVQHVQSVSHNMSQNSKNTFYKNNTSNNKNHTNEHHHHNNNFYFVTPIYYPIYTYPAPSYDNNASFPNGYWVSTGDDNIPDNAIVYEIDENNNPIYYCRAELNGQLYYGILSEDEGCVASNNGQTIHFEQYQILVGN